MAKKKNKFSKKKLLWLSLIVILVLLAIGFVVYKVVNKGGTETTGGGGGPNGGNTPGEQPPIECSDTDGQNHNAYGSCTDSTGTYHDACIDYTTLYEYYCDGNLCNHEEWTCEGSCVNGKCVNTKPQQYSCCYGGGQYACYTQCPQDTYNEGTYSSLSSCQVACKSGPGVTTTTVQSRFCYDGDSKGFTQTATCNDATGSHTNYCSGGYLIDYYCYNDECFTQSVNCRNLYYDYICMSGRCMLGV